jgi:hypothetical protein
VLGAAVAVVLALAAPSAQASKYVHRTLAEGAGTLEGKFGPNAPLDVAVNFGSVADGATDPLGDSVDGYVYVVDVDNHRIQVFGPDGEFKFMWGRGVQDGADAAQVCDSSEAPCTALAGFTVPVGSGGQGGMFNRPQGVAIDQDSGHVFVPESDNRRVQEFEADGTFVRAWGWGVDGSNPSTGFETCFVAASCLRGSSGAGLGQFATQSFPTGGAIDVRQSNGDVIVGDPGNQRLQRFTVPSNPADPAVATAAFGSSAIFSPTPVNTTPTPDHVAVDDAGVVYASTGANGSEIVRYDLTASAFIDPIPVAPLTGTSPGARTAGLEIDPSSGNLFVARDRFVSGQPRFSPVFELDAPGAASAGSVTLVDTHVAGADLAWAGFGLDPDSGDLYMASPGRLLAAGDGPAPPAQAVFLPPTDVGSTEATLNVSIDPNGPLAVGYQVQLASSSAPEDFETVASGQLADGADPATISAEVSGLRPKTLYLVRVVATKAFGNPQVFTDGPVLLTKAAAPSLTAVRADAVDATKARLSGRVNPNGTATSYRFEYGIGAFDNVVPIPDAPVGGGFDYRFVAQQLSGLQPGTSYRYRLVATSDDDQLGATASLTKTFTTPAAAAGPQGRGYELVSPADKTGGTGVGEWYAGPSSLAASGFAGYAGERFAAQGSYGSMLLDSPQAYGGDWAFAERVGNGTGWVSHSPLTRPQLGPAFASFVNLLATSDDISRFMATSNNSLLLFPEQTTPEWQQTTAAVPFLGSWGGPGVAPRWELFGPADPTLIDDSGGTSIWRIALADGGSTAIGLTQIPPENGGIAAIRGMAGPQDPTSTAFGDLVAGRSVYLADASGELADSYAGTGARTLVNVCSGEAGVDRTLLPAVDVLGDLVAQECAAPQPGRSERLISPRGATLEGSGGDGVPLPEDIVSADGRRAFFLSPDPVANGVPNGTSSFCDSTGDTCPAQLYVRQDNGDGTFTTRWISRAEGGLSSSQDATLTGTVRFEGATSDGDKVLFRTNSPLTDDDPNGTGGSAPDGGVVTGSASNGSWDLYLYDFPDDPNVDPGEGELTRVSAGPDGDGDCGSPYNDNGVTLNSTAAMRFLSADGSRVYFTCTAPLVGVTGVPQGAVTTPADGSSPGSETNMYLFDASRTGDDRWRFVTRLPRSFTATLDSCASTGANPGSPFGSGAQASQFELRSGIANCVRGSLDGGFVTFFTSGRLTEDDPGSSPTGDIYAYEVDTDELTRISASQGGIGGSYICAPLNSVSQCHADAGIDGQNQVLTGPVNASLGVVTDPPVAGDHVAFFQSAARLVAGDTDQSYDVYQWRNGELSLLTPGTAGHALYKGNDRTGRNVFFASRDRLTWQDFDAVGDVYTARVGGGVTAPTPTPVCAVLIDACHGGGTAGVSPVARTIAPSREGNASPGARPLLSIGSPGAAARRRAGRRGVLSLVVRTNRPGAVSAVASARVGGRGGLRPRRVARSVVRAKTAGRVVVRLRLSSLARKRLRSVGRLRLAVRVTMPGARSRSVAVILPGAPR